MAVLNIKLLLVFITISISTFSPTCSSNPFPTDTFLTCFASYLRHHSNNDLVPSDVILTRNSSSFNPVLQSTIRNPRFSKTKPEIILLPYKDYHVQAAVICSNQAGLQIRVRSGGHDYEGLSYASRDSSPFLIIDLVNFRSIRVDVENDVAYVGSGATLGELYYRIAEKSRVHAFPAGSCPTVGVGGHVSGGGFGTIFRKYGLAADQVLDAKIVDVRGKVLTRKTMGEDLFWAIRGGGGSSFAIILSWKLRLVRVSPVVTVSHIEKTLEEGASKLFHKWQTTASQIDEDLFLHATTEIIAVNGSRKTVRVSFTALFLGPAQKLVSLMDANFPELGIQMGNCTEMSWIQSVLYFAGFPVNGPLEVLLNRNVSSDFFKAKSDYVREAISEESLEAIWARFIGDEPPAFIIWTPYGGKMSVISDSEIPFPHRKGNLFGLQYLMSWTKESETENRIEGMRRLYSFMEPYVSKSPRAAYFNYRDLDIGTNDVGNTSYSKASVWGLKYFKHNFNRLVHVKTRVDPGNFFRNEQSIPVLQPRRK